MTQIPPTAALPMPADGWRRLSPQEVQRRTQAMACLRDNTPQCQGQVYVNLFLTVSHTCGQSLEISNA